MWRLTEKNKKKVEATEMDAIRRSLRVSRLDRVRNEDLRERMGMKGTVVDDIEKRQLTWYGHVRRMPDERLPKQVWDWVPKERRKKGRPRKSWMEGVRKAMSARNLTDQQWGNRDEWKLGTGQRRSTF